MKDKYTCPKCKKEIIVEHDCNKKNMYFVSIEYFVETESLEEAKKYAEMTYKAVKNCSIDLINLVSRVKLETYDK